MTAKHAFRQGHRSQRGLTLIELLVASSITAVIVLALGAAISLSVSLVGPQGVQGQEVAANSAFAAERQLSSDVSQAECVTTNGACIPPVATPGACAGTALCVAWCAGSSQQVATYALSGGDLVRRDAQGTLIVAHEIQSMNFTPSISSGTPQLQVNMVAGNVRLERFTFTARSLVTGAAACL